jgi:hypothetical protein
MTDCISSLKTLLNSKDDFWSLLSYWIFGPWMGDWGEGVGGDEKGGGKWGGEGWKGKVRGRGREGEREDGGGENWGVSNQIQV